MIEIINKTNLFMTTVRENHGLLNVFSSVKATIEQSHDLLRFRQIGQDGLTNYINYYLLKNPRTKAPMHGNKLVTMAPRKKVGKRQMNQKEKEMKQVTKCLCQLLAWCNRTKQTYDPNQEQYSLLPLAIYDENGIPTKALSHLEGEVETALLKLYNTSGFRQSSTRMDTTNCHY